MRNVDTLFVAMTRPAMKWGVPYDGLRLNLIVTFVFATLIVRTPLGFGVGVGVHLAMRELSRDHPFIFHKLKLWSDTKLKSTTASLWGASRLQPSAHRPKPHQIRSSV